MARLIALSLIVVVVCAAPAIWAESKPKDDGIIQFNRDIRPIVSENCFACHGPDPGQRKEGLRFDRNEGWFTPGKNGTFIVKGDPAHSLVYQRITSTDSDEVMPPVKTHKTLTPSQKDLIKRWIEQGACWQPHWSWIPPSRPAMPAAQTETWARNPIDAFVLAKLQEKGLTPAPEADRRSLIRRVTFDLTGLPPTPQEVEAFVNDPSANAYETLVDRLLASPTYGEQQARYWLDAVRYADTHGLHFDNYREMWPYRQWVINAFNRSEPFDQFTIEQLAGDLLPHPTLEQQIASGYNRCNETTNEGGTIAEENLVLYARDRTDAFGRVFLGLTVGCAVCHDHKFDPILQKDMYSLSAFFNHGTMAAFDGNIKDSPPSVVVPRPQDRSRWFQLVADIATVNQQLEERHKTAMPDFKIWLASADAGDILKGAPDADLLTAPLDEGQGLTARMTVKGVARDVNLASTVAWTTGATFPQAVTSPHGMVAEMPDVGDFDTHQPYTCAVWAKFPPTGSGAIVSRMTDNDNYRGWDLWMENNQIGAHLIHHWSDDAIKVISKKPIADPTKWHHLCVTYDGSAKATGVQIYIDGILQKTQAQQNSLKGTMRTSTPFKIGQRGTASPIVGLAVQDLRLYSRALTPRQVRDLASSGHMAAIVGKAEEKRTAREKTELYDWWVDTSDLVTQQMNARLQPMEEESQTIRMRGAETLVMQEASGPATAYVLYRGNYDQRRDKVFANTPQSLPPFPDDQPHNRLGLARWVIEPQNPLFARVTVNRFWQELFGNGIVKTAGDFGIMGELPSHPELLDWLAIEFRESGWDVKHMFKLMVMSATYRQATIDTPQKLEVDPDNQLLSRGPRYRLDAEEIRDGALACSDELVEKIGGPSVRPYQPINIWNVVGLPQGDTRNYIQDHGEGLYRRSVYTFWKRQAPPPSMEIFNAPARDVCTVRRDLTDTPLQALVTLNDTQFVEAARNLAQHAMVQGGKDFDNRINFMGERVLSRPFRPEEIAVAQSAYADLLGYYQSHADEAKQLLAVGESPHDLSLNPAEHAAWTMLANQIMNLDEALNK